MENKLLLNLVQDRYEKFQRSYSIISTDFLDLAQQSAVSPIVRDYASEGAFFYGGYENADRRQIVFVPDYTGVEREAEIFEYFKENPAECPVVVLDVTVTSKGAELKHSDYLGSLLALGIKREKTGDIIIHDGGAQILVSREISAYLAENYTKAGRVSLKTKILEISELTVKGPKTEEKEIPVSSVRLDNIVSAVFGVSRKSAVEAINKGIVFVDSVETKKPDFFLKGGEKIVLRGKGKAIYNGVTGTSRKGKSYANFTRYI